MVKLLKKISEFFSVGDSKNLEFKISRKLGRYFLFSVLVLGLLFCGSILYIIKSHNETITAKNIINENRQLQERITTISNEIDSVLVKIKVMEEWEDSIRSDKKLKSISKEIREMGIGGYPQIDTTFSSLGPIFNLKYNLTLNKLNQLKSKVDFDYLSHIELHDKVKLKELLYRNTPSVYPAYGRITESFGWRIHPLTKKKSFHYGVDFANKIGTPIYATSDGVVKEIGRKKYFGKYLALSHKFGYQTNYAHLHKIYVKRGQKVKRGQIIAEMGNSGRSTGPHLHYEVIRYNKHRNPYYYLNKFEDDIVLSKN